jgi:hypothetical protein
MTDKKFSEFVAKPTPLSTDEVVGFSGGNNIRIPVSSLSGGDGTITSVDGTAPISVDNTTDPAVPVVSISNATTSADGAMSSGDKIRLDSLPSSPVTGVTGTLPIEVDSTAATIPAISINAATTSLPGSMSAADKEKLDELVEGGAVNLDAIFEDLKGRAADYPILIECTGQSNLGGVTLIGDDFVPGTVTNNNVREIRQPVATAVANPTDTVTLELTTATVDVDYGSLDKADGWIGMQGTTPEVVTPSGSVGGENNNIGWTCCDLIQKATGHPVVMVQTWKSGQSIEGADGWLPDGGGVGVPGHMNDLRTHALNTAFEELADEGFTDIKVSASIWVQGENNAATLPQTYYDWWEEIQDDNIEKVMYGSRTGWQTKDLTRTYIGFTNTANGAGMKLIQKPIMDDNGSYVQYINSIGTDESDSVHFDNASLNYLGKLTGLALLAPVPPKRMQGLVLEGSSTQTNLKIEANSSYDQAISLFNEERAASRVPQPVTYGGQKANASASAGKEAGGNVIIAGGDGSSGAVSPTNASGGNVKIDGGAGYGDGTKGLTLLEQNPWSHSGSFYGFPLSPAKIAGAGDGTPAVVKDTNDGGMFPALTQPSVPRGITMNWVTGTHTIDEPGIYVATFTGSVRTTSGDPEVQTNDGVLVYLQSGGITSVYAGFANGIITGGVPYASITFTYPLIAADADPFTPVSFQLMVKSLDGDDDTDVNVYFNVMQLFIQRVGGN